ncbi:MAG: uncharacterized protein A8A55_1525 [Amphiamblys sp. WSBS2006]|nr:MAG: uncharacterized protein A8A55_1525 [Amphiamblys sp. WSBS2006]
MNLAPLYLCGYRLEYTERAIPGRPDRLALVKRTERRYCWILNVIDSFSKFMMVDVLKTKGREKQQMPLERFLAENLVCCTPITGLNSKANPLPDCGRSMTPGKCTGGLETSQSQVEQENQTLKRKTISKNI